MPNKSTKQKTLASTLETVDFALYNWLMKSLTSTQILMKVVERFQSFGLPQKSFSSKDNKELREIDSQAIIYPAMVVEELSFKTNANERVIPGNIFPQMDRKKGFPLYRRVVKDKTQNFQNAEAKKYTNQNKKLLNSI